MSNRNFVIVVIAIVMVISGVMAYFFYTPKTVSALSKLSDKDLYYYISDMIDYETRNMYPDEAVEKLDGAKKVFYVANYFSNEWLEGGLCQYLVNASKYTAPYIEDSLRTIGANKTRKLLTQFIHNNGIDVHNLEKFTVYKYDSIYSKYATWKFDNSMEELYYNGGENIHKLLAVYAREHLEELIK